ncbi:phage DNA replication protein [Streptococcus acidominimus]|uniref:Phage DNA replication protein n=1 Tax=Streptococcus acidominimus TaxID=1326 RepID=A0A239X0Y9_STRAI|nr:ATP-binding protein [Streptococcus acidominimus]SNV39708.1 phage DNA replication protein [Streptococcus acidominimus]
MSEHFKKLGSTMTFKGMVNSGLLVDTGKICDRHDAPIYLRTKPENKQAEVCWACAQEGIEEKKQSVDVEYQNQSTLARGYQVFFNESILSKEVAKARFDNFEVKNQTDQEALNYGKRLARDYVKGMEGNAVLKGPTGVGKSHLSMAIAKQINETFKSYNQARTVIFVSVAKLMQLLKDNFDKKDSKYSQERMTKLLTECDYLILDDLGKESTTGNSVRSTGDWKYSFLFNILDNRETTIINTNFSVKELQKIYDKAFVSRVLKGAKNKIFSYPDDATDKRF